MAGEAGLLKSLKPRIRIQSEDIKSAALWGFVATTTALWVVQPFSWLKKTFLEKPEPEK